MKIEWVSTTDFNVISENPNGPNALKSTNAEIQQSENVLEAFAFHLSVDSSIPFLILTLEERVWLHLLDQVHQYDKYNSSLYTEASPHCSASQKSLKLL